MGNKGFGKWYRKTFEVEGSPLKRTYKGSGYNHPMFSREACEKVLAGNSLHLTYAFCWASTTQGYIYWTRMCRAELTEEARDWIKLLMKEKKQHG